MKHWQRGFGPTDRTEMPKADRCHLAADAWNSVIDDGRKAPERKDPAYPEHKEWRAGLSKARSMSLRLINKAYKDHLKPAKAFYLVRTHASREHGVKAGKYVQVDGKRVFCLAVFIGWHRQWAIVDDHGLAPRSRRKFSTLRAINAESASPEATQ